MLLPIFFISEQKPTRYPSLEDKYTWVPIHEQLTFSRFSELYRKHKPYHIYTYGSFTSDILNHLDGIYQLRRIWSHLNYLDDLDVNGPVFNGIFQEQPQDKEYPLVSIFSSSFHSKEKIKRPLRSLQAQSYRNWEWIIWDDSNTDETYKQLLEMQQTDFRIRVYKAPEHSGSIGEMKRLACGVAYGEFLVEVDHDDDLHPDLLKWIVDASKQHPDATFFYTECCELEEETYKSVSYGNFFGMGYSAHMNIWSDFHKCYITTAAAPKPNPTSLSHIVGVPNHVRAWKTSFYDQIGKHNVRLPVGDDYELMLRSYLEGKWCSIRKCGYYQYRNKDGNFTFIRNKLIQHNVFHTYRHYQSKLPPKKPARPGWSYDGEEYPATHVEYIPEPHTRSIVVWGDPNPEHLAPFMDQKGVHVYVMGKLPDIPDAWKPNVSWWTPPTDKKEDSIRLVEKFFHVGKTIEVLDLKGEPIVMSV